MHSPYRFTHKDEVVIDESIGEHVGADEKGVADLPSIANSDLVEAKGSIINANGS